MDLGKDNIVRLIFHHSVPATVGMLVNAVYNLADRISISYAVGPEAFSSMSVASAVFLVLQAFGMWIGIGTASLIAIKMGERRRQRVEELIGGALVTLAASSWAYPHFLTTCCIFSAPAAAPFLTAESI